MLKNVGDFFLVSDFAQTRISLLYMKILPQNHIKNLATKYYKRKYRMKVLVSFYFKVVLSLHSHVMHKNNSKENMFT